MNCGAHLGLGTDPGHHVGLRKEVAHRGDTLYLIYKATIPNTHHSWAGEKSFLSTRLFKPALEGLKSI